MARFATILSIRLLLGSSQNLYVAIMKSNATLLNNRIIIIFNQQLLLFITKNSQVTKEKLAQLLTCILTYIYHSYMYNIDLTH